MFELFWHHHSHSLQFLTGSLQGENRGFPVKFFHTGKNLFSIHGTPAMKTGFSLWEKLHMENLVFITGMGLQWGLDGILSRSGKFDLLPFWPCIEDQAKTGPWQSFMQIFLNIQDLKKNVSNWINDIKVRLQANRSSSIVQLIIWFCVRYSHSSFTNSRSTNIKSLFI